MRSRTRIGAAVPPALVCALAAPAAPPLANLPAYSALLEEARARNPELQRARAALEAAQAQVPQAGALPDPELSLGFQRRAAMDVVVPPDPAMGGPALMGQVLAGNEFSLMASQSLPWPGKRALREGVSQAAQERGAAELGRQELELEGALLEGLLSGLTLEAELKLLEGQERSWAQAEALARQRGEVGGAAQSDLLQAMMERTRLAQRRLQLEAQIQDIRSGLNRRAGRPAETPLDWGAGLEEVSRPVLPVLSAALEDTWRRSPEWRGAQAELAQSDRAVDLSQKERRPDFRISGGVMKEPGMGMGWKAEFGMALPIFSGRKQRQVVTQRQAEQRAVRSGREALRQDLELRTRERLRAWELAERQARLFEEGLLPQGELAIQSLLGQYEAGRSSFQALLEALNARLRDRQAHLELLAQLHRLAIAQHRLALEATPGTGLPGSGAAMARPALGGRAATPSPTAQPDAAAATPMKM